MVVTRSGLDSAATSGTPWPVGVTQNTISHGMRNPAAWCYRRAVLQALLHVPEFLCFLSSVDRTGHEVKDCTLCSLRAVAELYWSAERTRPGVVNIVNQFDKAFNAWINNSAADIIQDEDWSSINRQQDAAELLRLLINQPEEHIAALTIDHQTSQSIVPGLQQLFTVSQSRQHRWSCRSYRQRPTDHDIILKLNFPPPDGNASSTTLDDCLTATFRSQQDIPCYKKTNDITHTNCKMTEVCKLTVAPPILVIQLVRVNDAGGKDRRIINYPRHLCMTKYSRMHCLYYQLSGVVCHRGSDLKSGHYVAVVKEPGRFEAVCNDTKVERMLSGPSSYLLKPHQQNNDNDAYLLFYTKVPAQQAHQLDLARQALIRKKNKMKRRKANHEHRKSRLNG